METSRKPDARISGPAPLVLYSANTRLAHGISERYYNDEHYVWCTPYFDGKQRSELEPSVPPTSSPYELYRAYAEAAYRGDRHSGEIAANRTGILRGAKEKCREGTITAGDEEDIGRVVELAGFDLFRPLMYVIPYCEVADLVREVPVEDKAHPLSAEYVIDRLPRTRFDVLRFG